MVVNLSDFLNTSFSTFVDNDAFNTTVVYPITLTHTTTNTPGTGIGTGLKFVTETSAGNNEIGGLIDVVATDVTSGSEDFDFVFKTMAAGGAAAERLRIASTGDVTVSSDLIVTGGHVFLSGATSNTIEWNVNGVAAPAFTTRSAGTKLMLYPQIGPAAVDYAIGIASSTMWYSIPTAGAAVFFRWYGGTTVAASLTGAGTFTATGDVCAFSDVRLKDNIQVIQDPLTKVLKLRGVTFTRKDLDDSKTHMGVIAQEVESVVPEVVVTGEDGIKTVAYGNMAGLLIEAIKQLSAQNAELLARVQKLESK